MFCIHIDEIYSKKTVLFDHKIKFSKFGMRLDCFAFPSRMNSFSWWGLHLYIKFIINVYESILLNRKKKSNNNSTEIIYRNVYTVYGRYCISMRI